MENKLKKLKNIYGELCVYCSKDIATTIDHIIPTSRYGPNLLTNLLPACKKCNSKKSSLSIYEFCSEDILFRIDEKRQVNKFVLLSEYTSEKDLPLERMSSKKSSINTQQKLKKLEFTTTSQILIGCYLYNKVHKTDKAKRIISLIYQSHYSEAIQKIKEYNSVIPLMTAINMYCPNKKIYNHYIDELISFFDKKRDYEIRVLD